VRLRRILGLAALTAVLATGIPGVASAEPGSAPGAASRVTVSDLVLRESVRGPHVLVPRTWGMKSVDGGGSGSSSTWTNPRAKSQWVALFTGVEVGGWFELDGVSGSIDPSGFFPSNAKVTRLSRTMWTYTYAGKPGKSQKLVRGAWFAQLDGGDPMGYLQVEVSMDAASQAAARRIITDFVRRYG